MIKKPNRTLIEEEKTEIFPMELFRFLFFNKKQFKNNG